MHEGPSFVQDGPFISGEKSVRIAAYVPRQDSALGLVVPATPHPWTRIGGTHTPAHQ